MTDLEQRLRATLHERSGDITAVPPHLLDDTAQRGRPRWLLPVAAAAAVLLVAGIVLALRGGDSDRSAPPAASSCLTDLPDAWSAAISSGALNLPPGSRTLAMLNNGTLVVQEAGGDALLDNGTVHAVSPSGSDRMLLNLPFVGNLEPLVRPVGRSEFIIALTVSDGPRLAPTTTPPRSGTPTASADPREVSTSAIYLVDAVTGTRTTIARADSAHVIGGVAVLGGAVFYDVHPEEVASGGTVQAYDVAEGRHRVQYRGSIVGTVTGTPIGVDWGSGSVDADLPDNVKAALTPDAVTDGTAYAVVGQGGIIWADRDGTVRGPFDQHVAGTPVIDGVAGPDVFFHPYDVSDDLYVLDTRTNAVASTGLQQNGSMPSAGGYVVTGQPAHRIDTNGLPELTC